MAGKAQERTTAKNAWEPYLGAVDARPDTLDFRDRMYVPTLVEVPEHVPLSTYTRLKLPVLDQLAEGACTGFGLAAVANFLLWTRKVKPRKQPVSARMLYEMARRYDEWPGADYEGSSARGAMKGWNKHGVCSGELWKYTTGKQKSVLTEERARDASSRPLGAYFRVNHRDLVAMHAALAEVGILYATAATHAGWSEVDARGHLPYEPSKHHELGGHAFAIVAYDDEGFWIQNSWSAAWGKQGFAHLGYADWLAHGTDVWVARLAVPIDLLTAQATATSRSAAAGARESLSQADLRPHLISIGNDGRLRTSGAFGTSADEVHEILHGDFVRLTKTWKKRRLLLYAHGGLVAEGSAVQRIADYRSSLLEAEVYPLGFIWKTDFWTTISNILADALRRRRPEGFLDAAKDFMLDRLDDALEPLARLLTGKAAWDEMKENALRSTTREDGGARLVAAELAQLSQEHEVELHVVGHSAGSIFHAPLVQRLATQGQIAGAAQGENGHGLPIKTCTLWAPACTMEVFHRYYLPLIRGGEVERFALFTLTDEAERDDHCAGAYHKSLLYLVSHAFEKTARIPVIRPRGEPLLGLQKSVSKDPEVSAVLQQHDWILSPNTAELGSPGAARATRHGDFDDDKHTVQATLARILGEAAPEKTAFAFERSASSMRDQRQQL